MMGLPRHIATAAAVLALHAAAVWALNAGLRMRAVEIVVPVQMLAALVDTPAPVAPVVISPPAPPEPRPVPPPVKQAQPRPVKAAPKPLLKPSPKPAPVLAFTPTTVMTPLPPTVDPTPSPNAPTSTQLASAKPAAAPALAPATTPSAVAPAAMAAPVASTVATPEPKSSPPAPPAVELPSTAAQYLQNPKPRYPPISLRLGEQGTVRVQVLVNENGLAKDVQVETSSGFYRLDNAALTTVLTWRFVPGKRAGVPTAMWFTVPITFDIQ